MQICWLERVDSTQRYLLDALKTEQLQAPVAVVAEEQYAGQGSRDNGWSGFQGNLFLSFAVSRAMLPEDLKLESASIYFMYLLKEVLDEAGSKVWLKWPNDLYIEEAKVGGAITNMVKDSFVCGIGVNLKAAPEGAGKLDIEIEQKMVVEAYFEKMKSCPSWKQIFSKFELEFERCRAFYTHAGDSKVLLENAILLEDGSIECNGQRIYSLR